MLRNYPIPNKARSGYIASLRTRALTVFYFRQSIETTESVFQEVRALFLGVYILKQVTRNCSALGFIFPKALLS